MLILFGTRRSSQNLGRAVHPCARCQQQAWFNYTRTSSYFTLFFIPLIPLSSTTIAMCTSCGLQQPVPNATADQTLAHARMQLRQAQQGQQYPPR